MNLPVDITHPAWISGFGTILGYGLMLAVLTAAFFLIPYLLFSLL